jgi:hypothetical protein
MTLRSVDRHHPTCGELCPMGVGEPGDFEVGVGLGRIVALYCCSSTLYRIHQKTWCLYF